MPFVNVKLFEHRLQQDPELSKRLAIAIDKVVAEYCTGSDGRRPETWVTVEGVPREQWTFNGELR
ncbi:hypothetical protein C7K25_11925 [Gulosibacter molinativorax]|uniref:4-oxalocrotonate tautomerase domain-containing protein n=1 Tax=Gulosibacter molinativorax TaxID=256821 RepID=A0ABT7CA44_9MICO|nr:hypothetical protein [Gulosibacter molinativorax]QUY63883.1 Hypotetical protein [Gulosibacter molinativorax]